MIIDLSWELSTADGNAGALGDLASPDALSEWLDLIALACLRIEGIERASAALRIVSDEAIRALNRDFRGIDRATDVLSFPSITYHSGTAKDNMHALRRAYDPDIGAVILGDFAISLPQAARQAEEYGHSIGREIGYLTVHAMFHLMGYDHEREEDKRVMRALEERALEEVGLGRGD